MVNAPGRWPSLVVTVWNVLSLFAGLALLVFSFVDMAFAGDLGLGMDSDIQFPSVDNVNYTLAGFWYFHESVVLTGPHLSLPLALLWLTLSALLMWAFWRRWALREARQALRASLFTLALVTVAGGAVLTLATWQHNRILQDPTLGHPNSASMTSAWPATLTLSRCTFSPGPSHCQKSTFPNPAFWAVTGVFITAVAGLWRSPDQED